ncbi:hypothetical protein [Dyella mobilis]|uniref:Uncharacterized protein n=1 Tax=Dyella mobilis TaxID=1849582 RepID=A0ABS2KKT0_9GAMM|nr:hypothetical protein [Dyella mobilis]MBM7131530.1 hypothetical protein [Dyella mobilis]GLQ96499.1 hypothetical protein GCM10007863_09170 [Dyella mobilis]
MFRKPASFVVAALIWAIPFAALATDWPETPVPVETQISPVAKRIVYNGMDMHASVFDSHEHSADILAFYRKVWGGKVVVNEMGGKQIIAHREGDYFTTVEVADAGEGSKGQIGVIDLATAPRHPEPGKGFARPEGTKVFNDIAYPDDPVPARTIAMDNGLSAGQNAEYFREHLLADGWKPADGSRCAATSCVLSYERGSGKLTVVVVQDRDDHSQVVINVQDPNGVTP